MTALEAQNDPDEDDIDDDSLACETLQDDRSLSASARSSALTTGSAISDSASRAAFQSTKRLMQELDMVRPTAEEFMQSTLAVPSCGVVGWLTAPPACAGQVPAAPFTVSNNCARLLSSHVAVPTITDPVFRLCTEALRTIRFHPYSDATCTNQVVEDLTAFAGALYDKATPATGAVSAASSTHVSRNREIGQ